MVSAIKIDHVAIMVSDLEQSLRFYRDLLGLEVVSPEEHNDGPISIMTGIPKVHMREYRLRAPGGVHGHTRHDGPGFTFDLIQWLNPQSPRQAYPINHVPSAHICFGVQSVREMYEKLTTSGVSVVSPPVKFSGEGEWHVLFFYDPDGNLLELNETSTGKQVAHSFEWSGA